MNKFSYFEPTKQESVDSSSLNDVTNKRGKGGATLPSINPEQTLKSTAEQTRCPLLQTTPSVTQEHKMAK